MHRTVWMIGALAVAVAAACSPKDRNFLVGPMTQYDSVSIVPTSTALHVRLIPDSIFFDSTAGHPDTIPAHEVPVDSTLLAVMMQPQDVILGNGVALSQVTLSDDPVVTVSDLNYIVPVTTGTTQLTIAFTDHLHSDAVTTRVIPITVTQVP